MYVCITEVLNKINKNFSLLYLTVKQKTKNPLKITEEVGRINSLISL